jgi:hypothetical protein
VANLLDLFQHQVNFYNEELSYDFRQLYVNEILIYLLLCPFEIFFEYLSNLTEQIYNVYIDIQLRTIKNRTLFLHPTIWVFLTL